MLVVVSVFFVRLGDVVVVSLLRRVLLIRSGTAEIVQGGRYVGVDGWGGNTLLRNKTSCLAWRSVLLL